MPSKRSRQKKESTPKKQAIIFFYKDDDGDAFLCCSKQYPRYRSLFDEDVMRKLVLDFCKKDARGRWEEDYVKNHLFAQGESLAKDKTRVVYMIDCFIDEDTDEKFKGKPLQESYDVKDIKINSILLASYYGNHNGIYINLVSSSKTQKKASASVIMNYFLKVFFNKEYTEYLVVSDSDEEIKAVNPQDYIKQISGNYDFLDPKVYKPAHKVLLDSVLDAVGYYNKNFNFQLREKCENRNNKSNKFIETKFYSSKRSEYQSILRSLKPTVKLSDEQKQKKLAFEKFEKSFFSRLEQEGFKEKSKDPNVLVRMKLCPVNSKGINFIYVEDDEEEYEKFLKKAKEEIEAKPSKKKKSK